ncbi:MAG: dissimilatory-type sulfite reductase subunit alpha [Desulfurispora sp.]|uniref:dissimilatory-type sulfite reductase subunit alpha n=1 Tax=Desulfurispora sp. TaxID=3014275 RepID=UPI00404B1ACA
MAELKTPLLDQLTTGPWPSFVADMKRLVDRKPTVADVLAQLELSYEEKKGHWKHGGIVGVMGYGGGVIGRYSDMPGKFPNVAEFHTMRLNQPSGWFYTTKALRDLMKIWDKYGSGLTNMHGSTGDIILLGTVTENLQPAFDEFSELGWDLGGSGSDLRTPSCCVGPARCESACIDTLDLCYDLTQEFQDELHRPMWPYKFKIKISGCANDCVASIARSDFAIIGTWRDDLKIDQEAVREYVNSGFDIQGVVIDKCPTKCLTWTGSELVLDGPNCVRCMHCINKMPKALRPGDDKGATLLIGGKATILQSAFLGWVIVPFMKLEKPYDELKDLLRNIWEWWDEHGKVRERIGELIYRKGMRVFLKDLGLDPLPQMVFKPRANPYFFWWPEEVNQG